MEDQQQNFGPIPKLFKSDLTGDHIKTCIKCECNLHEQEEGYFIEKALKPYDGFNSYSTVFEYGMCVSCMLEMRDDMSEESKANISNYFSQKVDIQDRATSMEERQEEQEPDVYDWVNQCVVYGTHIIEIGEAQILAFCQGDQIIYNMTPYMLSGKVSEDVLELISAKTLNDLNNFGKRLTDSPPEFKELLEKKQGVFV